MPINLVQVPGDIVGTPPYSAEGCLMQAFFLDGKLDKQQEFVDCLINEPSNGELTFTVLSDQILLTVIYVETMRSLSPIDGQKGVIAEYDLGFWIGVFGGKTGEMETWRARWFPAFLFVDTPSAMASGREAFGYPKTQAAWNRSSTSEECAEVSLDVLHYPVYGPTKRPMTETLIRITQTPQDNVLGEILSALNVDFWNSVGLAAEWGLGEVTNHIKLSISMPQLLLRQLRDACSPGDATSIEVLDLDVKCTDVPLTGKIPGDVYIELAPSASHPIASKLGIAAHSKAKFGIWARQDFTVGAASTLWCTP